MASRKANPAVIGGFVLGALALSVAAALVLSSGRLFQKSSRWVIFFDTPVTGLDIGAPVRFRGVQLGSVVEVAAFVDAAKDIVATPVYIEIMQGAVRLPEGVVSDPQPTVKRWIRERDFRAQLKSQSFVTGKLYVDVGFHPKTPLDLKGLDPTTPEIPAVPTQMEEIERLFETAAKRIEAMPLQEIAENLAGATASLDELLADPALKSSVANLDGALAETRALMAKVNEGYDGIEADVTGTLEQAEATLARMDEAVAEIRGLVAPGSPLNYEILVALEEITGAARSIRALGDALDRDPNQLIFGKGRAGGDD
jgi:paraquat-inducible protein B